MIDKYQIGFLAKEEGDNDYVRNRPDDIQKRWSSSNQSEGLNVIGYGNSNPWEPPLKEPETLLGVIDRHIMTAWTGGPIYWFGYIFYGFMNYLIIGDSLDGFWYNNPEAVGA